MAYLWKFTSNQILHFYERQISMCGVFSFRKVNAGLYPRSNWLELLHKIRAHHQLSSKYLACPNLNYSIMQRLNCEYYGIRLYNHLLLPNLSQVLEVHEYDHVLSFSPFLVTFSLILKSAKFDITGIKHFPLASEFTLYFRSFIWYKVALKTDAVDKKSLSQMQVNHWSASKTEHLSINVSRKGDD